MKHTINKEKEIYYVAINFTTGLTDVVLTVIKPDLTTLTPAVVEQGSGVYRAVYTPDTKGYWREEIISVVNGDKVFRSFLVEENDSDDLKLQHDTLDTRLTVIESKIDALDVSSNPGGYFS